MVILIKEALDSSIDYSNFGIDKDLVDQIVDLLEGEGFVESSVDFLKATTGPRKNPSQVNIEFSKGVSSDESPENFYNVLLGKFFSLFKEPKKNFSSGMDWFSFKNKGKFGKDVNVSLYNNFNSGSTRGKGQYKIFVTVFVKGDYLDEKSSGNSSNSDLVNYFNDKFDELGAQRGCDINSETSYLDTSVSEIKRAISQMENPWTVWSTSEIEFEFFEGFIDFEELEDETGEDTSDEKSVDKIYKVFLNVARKRVSDSVLLKSLSRYWSEGEISEDNWFLVKKTDTGLPFVVTYGGGGAGVQITYDKSKRSEYIRG